MIESCRAKTNLGSNRGLEGEKITRLRSFLGLASPSSQSESRNKPEPVLGVGASAPWGSILSKISCQNIEYNRDSGRQTFYRRPPRRRKRNLPFCESPRLLPTQSSRPASGATPSGYHLSIAVRSDPSSKELLVKWNNVRPSSAPFPPPALPSILRTCSCLPAAVACDLPELREVCLPPPRIPTANLPLPGPDRK